MPVPPPALGVPPTPEVIRSDVAAWLINDALIELVRRFDGPKPVAGTLDLVELQAWSAQHWDFRAGRERNLVDPDTVSGPLEEVVLEASGELGLRWPEKPRFEQYDFLLMLGGLVRACVWRPEYAAHLMAHGVTADSIYAVSGFRELNDAELDLLPAFGLEGVREEHEAMARALRTSFGVELLDDTVPLDESVQPNLRKRVAVGTGAAGRQVALVVAPSRDAARRANTPDSYHYWASEVAKVSPGQRVLMVTSPIYVPFQHADAVRMLGLPYGCVIDTVGIDPDAVDERGEPQIFRGVNHLQELNSTLRSYKALLDALDSTAG